MIASGDMPVFMLIMLVAGVLIVSSNRRRAMKRRGLLRDDWHTPQPSHRPCRRLECGHLNRPTARFCAQCGYPLGNEGEL
jgi:hypothetical protein